MQIDRLVESIAEQLWASLAPLGFGVECRASEEQFGTVLKVVVQFRVAYGPPVQSHQFSVAQGFVGHETEDWAKWFVRDTLCKVIVAMTEAARTYMAERPEIKRVPLEWRA